MSYHMCWALIYLLLIINIITLRVEIINSSIAAGSGWLATSTTKHAHKSPAPSPPCRAAWVP